MTEAELPRFSLVHEPSDRHPSTQRSLHAVSQIAPWCTGGAQTPRHGCFPFLAASEDGRRASLLLLGGGGDTNLPLHTLSKEACDAIKDAVAAANHAVPVMWTSFVELRHRFLDNTDVVFLNGVCCDVTAPDPDVVDGKSLGLAAALAVISATLRLPCPAHVLATACLKANGETGSVRGLPVKLLTVGLAATHARYVLVDRDNRADVEAARTLLAHHAIAIDVQEVEDWKPSDPVPSPRSLVIVLVQHLAEAIRVCWSAEVLQAHLLRLMGNERERDAIADALFHIALGDRRSALAWGPIERAASHTLETLKSPDSGLAWRLRFARTIASRYSDGVPQIALPIEGAERDHFAALPLPHRLLMAAHVVQNAASCASPDPSAARAWAEDQLPENVNDYTEGHLKLRGALGRLVAALGDARGALDHQLAVYQGWKALRSWSDMSYPLSEWFRLASLLEEVSPGGTLAEVEEAFLNLGAMGEHIFDDYMMHYRCRARILRPEGSWTRLMPTTIIRHLEDVWCKWRKPSHLRWASLRWLIRAHRQCGDLSSAEARISEAERCASASGNSATAVNLALIDIDRGHAPSVALDRLREVRPQPTGLLEDVARAVGRDAPEWVATWWP